MFSWNKIFNKELIIHPLNIILLFIINTSSQKIKAGLSIGFLEPAITFLFIFALSLAAYFVIKRFIKDRIKASLILSYILLVTLFFRDIVELIIYSGISEVFNFIGELFIVIILALILLAALTKWLFKTKRLLFNLNSYLNVLTIIFLTVEIIGCSFADVSEIELKERVELQISLNDTTEKPDIYFILLDGYTGFSGLEKLWNFDNNELKKFLVKNDFFFARNGRSIYN
ncbi:MAG: hypothetical protein Q7S39_06835, partial [Ignavibacteria bacterium]|nr:hypothetical protein [Ignavibacteria bacterium]